MPIIASRASAAYGAGFGAVTTIPFAGPFGAYDSLATITVGAGGVSSVAFTGVPSTYKHLQIRALVQTNNASRVDDFKIQYNGDTSSSNYYNHQLYGTGSAAGAQSFAADSVRASYIAGATDNANLFGVAVIDILDYASTTKRKTTRISAGVDYNGGGFTNFNSGGWFATPAIISVVLAPGSGTLFNQYSRFSLYGVK
jgi:hypothetical protein